MWAMLTEKTSRAGLEIISFLESIFFCYNIRIKSPIALPIAIVLWELVDIQRILIYLQINQLGHICQKKQ